MEPERIQFVESTTKAMQELSAFVHTLHNKITQLEIDVKRINLELEHLSHAIKPRGIK